MSIDLYFYFDGDCRDALKFYAGAFGLPETDKIMTYGQMPDFKGSEADKNRILHAFLLIDGTNVMFSDVPVGKSYVRGTNISPTLSLGSVEAVRTVFAALGEGGTVDMPLGSTFFSSLYGITTDRFGITWQIGVLTH